MYNYFKVVAGGAAKILLVILLEVTMEIKYQDVILRDFRESDIEDEIRWMNIDTAWMKADTPWEEFEPSDPEELRQIWMDNIQNMPPDAGRNLNHPTPKNSVKSGWITFKICLPTLSVGDWRLKWMASI